MKQCSSDYLQHAYRKYLKQQRKRDDITNGKNKLETIYYRFEVLDRAERKVGKFVCVTSVRYNRTHVIHHESLRTDAGIETEMEIGQSRSRDCVGTCMLFEPCVRSADSLQLRPASFSPHRMGLALALSRPLGNGTGRDGGGGKVARG